MTEERGSAALVKQWAARPRPLPEGLIGAAAEILDDFQILKVLTHGVPAVDRVVIRFESSATEDDFERCGNVLHGLHGLGPHAEGVEIAVRWLINGIPAFDRIIGELELGGTH